MQVGVTKELVNDALAISDAWSSELDLRDLIEAELRASGVLNLRVDVVAVGKAAREMASAARVTSPAVWKDVRTGAARADWGDNVGAVRASPVWRVRRERLL